MQRREPMQNHAATEFFLYFAGGASLSWKDRARITMAARLKLLVRFKQAQTEAL